MSDLNGSSIHRSEFVFFFDVADGNPNGDPDAGNAPRIDPETGHGLVTDVCLKRKVRNFIQLAQVDPSGQNIPGFEIYVKERGILANEQRKAYKALEKEPDNKTSTIKETRAWMCKNFYDVRAFGAVMSTGKGADSDESESDDSTSAKSKGAKRQGGSEKQWNCGQVRGPIQLSFARSIDPIVSLEHSITRVALTNPGDSKRGQEVGGDEATSGTFGRKSTIPYALYRTAGFISPQLARDTGFSTEDLTLFWQALEKMFELDRSASRGVMAPRALFVFEHESPLGNHPAHKLIESVQCERVKTTSHPRRFEDYRFPETPTPPQGVTLKRLF